jgi:hypothetical protein
MIDLIGFTLLALAAYRIGKLIIEDVIFEKIREKIFKKFPPETTKTGYFFTCYWCTSLWVATLLTVGYILVPSVMLIICLPLALSAVVGILSEKV